MSYPRTSLLPERAGSLFYVFLFVIAALSIGVYLLFILPNVPGAVEERLGVPEPLPSDLGVWKRDEESPEGRAALQRGEVREERTLFDEEHNRITRQTRYRDRNTDEIVRVDPEEVTKRRRVKTKGA